MKLGYPLGLLGLLGIPILILIYIIKNQYTEKVISSTYIWEVSERFLKKRLPISKLVGIISLILQILAVIFFSAAIAQPSFVLPGAADIYCFVLDGTGSMNFSEQGKTRFELAKEEIRKQISDSVKGSSYTLIYVGDSTEAVFEDISDKNRAITLLEDLEGGYRADDLSDAWAAAQEYFSAQPAARVVLFTDKNYEGEGNNVTVVNVSKRSDNYAVSDLSVKETVSGSREYLAVSGKVTSYVNDRAVTLGLYFDGEEEPRVTQELSLTALVPQEFLFEAEGITEFRSVRVAISLQGGLLQDDLALDNEAVFYNTAYENASRTLIVSETPFFLQAAFRAAGTTAIDAVSPEDYTEAEGYDLAVFDRFVPQTLPKKCAVWFVNPQESLEGTNFSFRGVSSPKEGAVYSASTASGVRALLEGVPGVGLQTEYELKQYVKLGLKGKFSTLLTCEGSPILFAGATAEGDREVVFAFDPKDSAAFVLSADFNMLVSNLLDYTFPPAIAGTVYRCGDTLSVNVIAGCESIRILSPHGKESYPDTGVPTVEYQLNEVGTYTVRLTMNSGAVRELNIFSCLPEEESAPLETVQMRSLEGERREQGIDGIYDDILYLLIALAVMAAAEFGVYCYEQYQLR